MAVAGTCAARASRFTAHRKMWCCVHGERVGWKMHTSSPYVPEQEGIRWFVVVLYPDSSRNFLPEIDTNRNGVCLLSFLNEKYEQKEMPESRSCKRCKFSICFFRLLFALRCREQMMAGVPGVDYAFFSCILSNMFDGVKCIACAYRTHTRRNTAPNNAHHFSHIHMPSYLALIRLMVWPVICKRADMMWTYRRLRLRQSGRWRKNIQFIRGADAMPLLN